MTDEERDIITRFIQRVGGAPQAGGALTAGSVPQTAPAPALPPIDPDADRLIGDLFTRYPEAKFRLTQTAFVQEHALVEAQNQINRLQYELQQAKQAAPPPAPAASPWGAAASAPPQYAPPPQSRGMFGGLFGGGQQAAPPPQYQQPQYAPPQPQFAPGYQPGMFQQRGSGFLGSALTTAAGVAGGMVAGNAIMGLFNHHEGGGGFGGDGFQQSQGFNQGQFGQGQGGAPWSGGATPDPYDVGGAPKDFDQGNAGGTSSWQDAGQPQQDSGGGGWQDTSTDSGGGWTDTGGGSDDINNT